MTDTTQPPQAHHAPIAGVIGWPIAHSRSPRLHGHWLKRYGINGHYLPLPVMPDGQPDWNAYYTGRPTYLQGPAQPSTPGLPQAPGNIGKRLRSLSRP